MDGKLDGDMAQQSHFFSIGKRKKKLVSDVSHLNVINCAHELLFYFDSFAFPSAKE